MKKPIFGILSFALLLESATANSMVTSVNKLGLRLAATAVRENPSKNIIVSPVSFQQAMMIALNGTAGATRDRVVDYVGAPLEEINLQSTLVMARLHSRDRNKLVHSPFLRGATVFVNNSLWHTTGESDGRYFEFSEAFQNMARNFYGAEVNSADFRQERGAAEINSWVQDKTNGQVEKIIESDELSPLLWMVVNTTHLEASWARVFQPVRINAPKFKLTEQQDVDVSMITSRQSLSYLNMVEGEAVGIPMAATAGSPDVVMVIFLPKNGSSLKETNKFFFEILLPDLATRLFKRENLQEMKITLPKFSFETTLELKRNNILTRHMGLNFLFAPQANFSLISTAGSIESVLGLIRQSSRIELDEKGIKAAAVTAVGGIERTSIPMETKVSVTVDRPFMFAIIEKGTDSILFTGSVIDPR